MGFECDDGELKWVIGIRVDDWDLRWMIGVCRIWRVGFGFEFLWCRGHASDGERERVRCEHNGDCATVRQWNGAAMRDARCEMRDARCEMR